jgi:hypothetical protein
MSRITPDLTSGLFFWEEQAVQKQSSEELCHQQNEAT